MESSPAFEYTVLGCIQVFQQFSLGLVKEVLAEVADLPTHETCLAIIDHRIVKSVIVVDRHILKSKIIARIAHAVCVRYQPCLLG